ncbi:MAG TPA: glycine cleavage system protein GcvH [Nitriliruptorales bacterium]
MSDDAYPDDLRYSHEHEWTRDEGDVVRVGITGFAQDQLGDVVYVDLPGVGAEVEQGQPFGEVESTKSVSDLYAPISGMIADRNEELDERPELVNQEPYGEGWMVTIIPSDRAELDSLMDGDGYRAHVGS